MGTRTWEDIAGERFSPAERKMMKRAAKTASERMGYGALRKARLKTQVELADKLQMSQAGVAQLENRTDLQLSTLSKYIRAMGGHLEIKAVFPDATFDLEPPAETPVAKRKTVRRAPRQNKAA